MSRLSHDLKDVVNSLSTIKSIMSQDSDELLKMKPIILSELDRLVSIIESVQEKAQ